MSASVLSVCPSDDWEKRCSCIASLKPPHGAPESLGGPGETELTPAPELQTQILCTDEETGLPGGGGSSTPLRPQSWLVVLKRVNLGLERPVFPASCLVWCEVPTSVLRIQSLMKEIVSTDHNYNPVCRGLEEPAELSGDRSAAWGPRGGFPGRYSLN